jgi:hypothetical protein
MTFALQYSNYLLANGQEDKVRTQLAPIILRDLDYVVSNPTPSVLLFSCCG